MDRLIAALADRYRIEHEIGRGGMATVYLARDIRHERPVALKVMRPELAAVLGPERFLREITITARLNHAHILPLLDSGEADGFLYYVMPFMEGEALRHRLDRERQLAIDEAVRIGGQVAAALAFAHRAGVVHRDIKPANVLLQAGEAIVADFGISLAVEAAAGDRLTTTGLSLGTPEYMSPEQASGERELDGRTDVYALGCVLYEMIAGDPPFSGHSAQAVIARHMMDPVPRLRTVRSAVPEAVEGVIHRALEKAPADRWPTAEAMGEALATAGAAGRTGGAPSSRVRRPLPVRRVALGLGAAGVVAAGMLWFGSRGAAPVELTIPLAESDTLFGPVSVVAISPDGETVVYTVRRQGQLQLMRWTRGDAAAEPLRGAEGADGPFFSPDGAWVGFWVEAERVMKKVPVRGGQPQVLAASDGAEGTWGENGVIVFFSFPLSGLFEIPETGGVEPKPLTRLEEHFAPDEEMHRDPHFLPGGVRVAFTGWAQGTHRVAVYDREQDTRVTLIEGGSAARYVDGGFLVYARSDVGELRVVSLDPETLELGTARPVLDGMHTLAYGYAHYGVSRRGHLAYVPGGPVGIRRRLLWVTVDGATEPIDLELGDYAQVRASPTGDQIAVRLVSGLANPKSNVWTTSLDRPALIPLVDDAGTQTWPVWSHDGTRLFFNSNRHAPDGRSPYNVYWKAADGTGVEERLTESPLYQQPYSVHPDGRTIAIQENPDPETGFDIAFVELGNPPTMRRVPELHTRANETHPAISPDGAWIAYISDATDRYEVYVRPLFAPGRPTLVSAGGGQEPVWAYDGTTIYYRDQTGDSVYAVPFDDGRVRDPDLLFTGPYLEGWPFGRNYDVAPDGRFLMVTDADHRLPAREIRVVLNWMASVRDER